MYEIWKKRLHYFILRKIYNKIIEIIEGMVHSYASKCHKADFMDNLCEMLTAVSHKYATSNIKQVT